LQAKGDHDLPATDIASYPRRKEVELPIAFLRECLDYDPTTGALTWRVRPREHFRSDNIWAKINTQWAGRTAGNLSNKGYLRIRVTFAGVGWAVRAHRVAWALVTGAWPKNQIDHRNGIRDDNRLNNLREATASENQHNLARSARNTSGYPGVYWDKNKGKWRAAIRLRRRHVGLGCFNDPARAYDAYLKEKARLHPFAPVPRGMRP
jgi:hypothetical protein